MKSRVFYTLVAFSWAAIFASGCTRPAQTPAAPLDAAGQPAPGPPQTSKQALRLQKKGD